MARSRVRPVRIATALIEHAVLEAEIAGFGTHLLHHGAAFGQLRLAEAELDPTLLLEPDIEPGALAEFGSKERPFLGRTPRPALIMRRAKTLCLHPDEPEIAARGAIGNIAFVDEDHPESGAGEAIADRRADQPAADHDRIEASHVLPPGRPARRDHRTAPLRSEGPTGGG